MRTIKKRALRKHGAGGGEAAIELVVHVVGPLDLELVGLNGRVITADYDYMWGLNYIGIYIFFLNFSFLVNKY